MIAKAILMTTVLGAVALTGAGCKKKFEIRDVDPERAGTVRSLGPESQDAFTVADQMVRSMEQAGILSNNPSGPLNLVLVELRNNTRYNFDGGVFNTLLRTEMSKRANGRYRFVARDASNEVLAEREAARSGRVDFDPSRRTAAPSGADLFLIGSAEGLPNVSTRGQSDTIIYSYKLVDSETMIELWMDSFVTKKEGRDDVIYR